MTIQDGLQRHSGEFLVQMAGDGKEALELIERDPPAMVVSDIRMPEVDGIELLLTCRKWHPHMPVVLVSAYFSEQLERSARAFGAADVMSKPIDLDELVATIRRVLGAGRDAPSADGFLSGFSLAGFLQILELEGKSCGVEVENNDGARGTLWLQDGQLWEAAIGDARGRSAALEILAWESGNMSLKPQRQLERQIDEGLGFLLMEAARLADERKNNNEEDDMFAGIFPDEDGPKDQPADDIDEEKEKRVMNMQEVLGKAKDVSGFVAVGAFSAHGELLAEVSNSGTNLAEMGALANDVLLKAQKSTDVMGVGRGNLVHIEAPGAHVLVRCLNESSDFGASEAGHAHVHVVLVMEPDGNMAMGKMRINSLINELAPLCR